MTETRTQSKQKKNLFQLLQEWILHLAADLKILIEIMGDPEMELSARSLAFGTLAYLLSPLDLIPDKIPIIGLVDDVIIIRLSLEALRELDPERMAFYEAQYPETFEQFEEAMAVLRASLGLIYDLLAKLVETLKNRNYKGHSSEEAVQSEEVREQVLDDAMEYVADQEMSSQAIHKALLEAPSYQIIGQLTAGLSEEDVKEIQEFEAAKRLEPPREAFRKFLTDGTDAG